MGRKKPMTKHTKIPTKPVVAKKKGTKGMSGDADLQRSDSRKKQLGVGTPLAFEVDGPPLTVDSPEWPPLIQRRAALIGKKNREGLTRKEKKEYEELERIVQEVMDPEGENTPVPEAVARNRVWNDQQEAEIARTIAKIRGTIAKKEGEKRTKVTGPVDLPTTEDSGERHPPTIITDQGEFTQVEDDPGDLTEDDEDMLGELGVGEIHPELRAHLDASTAELFAEREGAGRGRPSPTREQTTPSPTSTKGQTPFSSTREHGYSPFLSGSGADRKIVSSLSSSSVCIDPIKLKDLLWPDIYFYKEQEDIIYSVLENDETYVVAANQMGKDFVAAYIALYFFLSRSPCRVLTTSVDHYQLEGVLWGEIRRFLQTSKYSLDSRDGGPLVINHMHLRKIIDGKVCGISYMIGRVSAKGEGMLGHHVADVGDKIPRTLAVFDEASGIEDVNYEMCTTWAKRVLMIGNAWPTDNVFRKAVDAGDVSSDSFQLPSREGVSGSLLP